MFSRAVSTTVVTLHGELDESGGERLAAVLQDAIESVRNKVVVVDLRDVSAAEPSALNLFQAASARARRVGVSLRLYGPPAALSERRSSGRG
jgi:anti-anti-sigma factor